MRQAALALLFLVACSNGATPQSRPETNGSVAAPSPPAPVTVLSFHGSYDAPSNHVTMEYRSASGGWFRPDDTIPTGSGAGEVLLHTTSTAWTSATTKLTGSVTATNDAAVKLWNLTATIDSTVPSTVTNTGPYRYGHVSAGATASALTWSFTDPSSANFEFYGHVTAGLTNPCGLSSSKCVFLSSTTVQGNFGGHTVSDATCQTLATAAGLGGTFLSWVSDGTSNAGARMTAYALPYQWVDGTEVVTTYGAFASSGILTGIDMTEQGTLSALGVAWTDTSRSGSAVGTGGRNDCGGNWSSNSSSSTYAGWAGIETLSPIATWWTANSAPSCNNYNAFLCFEQ